MGTLKFQPAYQRADTDEIEPPTMSSSAVALSNLDSCKGSASVQGTPALHDEGDIDNHLSGPSERHGTGRRSGWRPRFEGWRAGASIAAILALLSLLINFVVIVWLGSKGTSALVSVYEGSCSVVAQIDIWVHLVINIVSTLLLGGSNYCSMIFTSSIFYRPRR